MRLHSVSPLYFEELFEEAAVRMSSNISQKASDGDVRQGKLHSYPSFICYIAD